MKLLAFGWLCQFADYSRLGRSVDAVPFLEIGRDALHAPESKDPEKLSPAFRVDYYSNAAGIDETRGWLSGPVNDAMRRTRLAQLGIDPARFSEALAPATMQSMSLLARDAKTGQVQQAHKKGELEGFIVPFAMMIEEKAGRPKLPVS